MRAGLVKTVTSPIAARGASARISSMVRRDLLPLEAGRHAAVVVAGLDDDQRGGQAGQLLGAEQSVSSVRAP